MKKIFSTLVAMAFAAIFAIATSAQTKEGQLYYSGGAIHFSDGTELSPSDAVNLFGKELYSETFEGATRQAEIGGKLLLPGIVSAGAGMVTILTGVTIAALTDGEFGAFTTVIGAIAFAAGETLISVGVPLRTIGASRLRWLTDEYNSGAIDATKSPMITFGAQKHGIGMAINF